MKRTALALTLIVTIFFSVAGEILFVRLAVAKPITQWSRDYPSLGEEGKVVVQTTDGGYAVAGDSQGKFLLLKVSAYGDVQWSKTYGDGVPYSLVQTNDGGYALAGLNNYGLDNFVKTDSEGNMQWSKTYESPYGAAYRVNSLIQTSDGGYALAGYTYNWCTDWFIKTDENGNIQWNKTYGMRYGFSLVEANDDGYVILVGGDIITQSAAWFFVKVDVNGNVQWNKTCISASYLIKTEDGGYILAASGEHPRIEKKDAQGISRWWLSLGENIITVAQAQDGGYVVAGNTYEDPFSFWGGRTARVIKISAAGIIEWTSDYPADSAPTWVNSIIATDDGYVFTGMKGYSGNYGDGAVWLVKISEEPTPTPTPSPTPTPTPSPSPSPSATPFDQQPEPFPTTLVIVASVATVAVVGIGLLFYFRKRKH
jgi:hypothetical protein